MLTAGDDGRSGLHVRARLPGLELLLGGGDLQRPILTSALCLVLGEGDGTRIVPGRQPFPRVSGTQLLVRAPAQVLPCADSADGPAPLRVLLIERSLLNMYGDVARRLTRFHSALLEEPAVVATARVLCDAVAGEADAEETRRLVGELLGPIVSAFTGLRSRPAPLTSAVARARDLLHERFAENVPLEELARAVRMSKCHLVHVFHRELGLPPHAYRIQLRVMNAQQLVAGGTPLAEIASLTGFADQSHLTRLFKRIVGMSPGRYAATVSLIPSFRTSAVG